MTRKCDTMLNLGNCYGLSSKKKPPKFCLLIDKKTLSVPFLEATVFPPSFSKKCQMHVCFSQRQSSYFGMQKCFVCSDPIIENTGKNILKG